MKHEASEEKSNLIETVVKQSHKASETLATTQGSQRSQAVEAMAIALRETFDEILEANTLDLETCREMAIPALILEWLKLTPQRLETAIKILERLGTIADPIGLAERVIRSPVDGILIGRTNLPLANEGDALFHIATFEKLADVIEGVGAFRDELEIDALD